MISSHNHLFKINDHFRYCLFSYSLLYPTRSCLYTNFKSLFAYTEIRKSIKFAEKNFYDFVKFSIYIPR